MVSSTTASLVMMESCCRMHGRLLKEFMGMGKLQIKLNLISLHGVLYRNMYQAYRELQVTNEYQLERVISLAFI